MSTALRGTVDPAALLAELRCAVDEPRTCTVLQALHVGCGAMALAALGIDPAPALEAPHEPTRVQ